MIKIDYKDEYNKLSSIENNKFKIGDMVEVVGLYDKNGNEINNTDDSRYGDLCKKGKIDSIFCNDTKGGYVYGIEECDYCFNKYELELLEQ